MRGRRTTGRDGRDSETATPATDPKAEGEKRNENGEQLSGVGLHYDEGRFYGRKKGVQFPKRQ